MYVIDSNDNRIYEVRKHNKFRHTNIDNKKMKETNIAISKHFKNLIENGRNKKTIDAPNTNT